jgi:uncharacterized damage-inducible protein DinB
MGQQTDSWLKQVDEVTNLFKNDFADLTEEQMNWKPSPDVWSIAQIIEHIAMTNLSYFPAIEQIKSGNYSLPVTSKISFLVKQFGNIIYKSVNRNNKKKVKTMSVWKPVSSKISGNIIGKFSEHQEELKNVIRSSEHLLERGTLISSPANRFIVYKLDRAFDIIVEHEFRHYGQAQQIKLLQNI